MLKIEMSFENVHSVADLGKLLHELELRETPGKPNEGQILIDDGYEIGRWKAVAEVPPKEPTLEEWLDGWAAAVEDGKSNITRHEAERRYHQKYG